MSDEYRTEEVYEEQGGVFPVAQDIPRVSPIPVLPQLGVALAMLLLVFGVTYLDPDTSDQTASRDTDMNVRVEKMLPEDMRMQGQSIAAFSDMELEASSAIVWDVATQRVLFNKNADDVRPLASVAKLMTALVAYELLDPDTAIPITTEAIRVEGDSGFMDGDLFTMQDLADLTLVESSNDGATALGMRAGSAALPGEDGNTAFVTAMNIKARELGLSSMSFQNSTGLDLSETEASAHGSARDVAHLMEYLITHHPDAAALTTLDTVIISDTAGKRYRVHNTNTIVHDIDGLIASKTGYTLLAGGNLVIAVNLGLNRPVVIAVLGSSTAGRFRDAFTLYTEAKRFVAEEQTES